MSLSALEAEVVAHEQRRRLYTTLFLTISILLIFAGLIQSESMNSGDFFTGLSKFFQYPGEIVAEAWASGLAFFSLFPKFLPLLIETLNIALVSTIIGTVFAVIFSLLASRNLDVWPPLTPLTRRVMDILRAFPELIVALVLIFMLGANALPAVIAVALHTSGALGKLFSEVNENIDPKPVEGLKATGGRWLQRIRFGVLPQVAPNYLSYALLRLEINVRASAILGYVGAGGIGVELRRTIGWGQGSKDETAMIFLMLFLSIMVIDQISSFLRGRLIGGGPTS